MGYKCESRSCGKEVAGMMDTHHVLIEYEGVNTATGTPAMDDLQFIVCSVECGLRLIQEQGLDMKAATRLVIKKPGEK